MSHEFTLWHSQALANARQDNNHDLHKALRTYAPQYRYGFEACEQHYAGRITELEAKLAEAKKDAERLNFIEHEMYDLRCISTPNADAGDYSEHWEVISHHMDKPNERTEGHAVALRKAIDQAIERENV